MLLLRHFPILARTIFAIFALAIAGLLLHRLTVPDKSHCAGCIGYALKINSMIDDARDNVRGNAQFFRYAVDKACAGRLLDSGRCLEHRRGFLRDKARYFHGIEDPYAACRAISAC
ncbi:uncharacterized protein EURHEDRAFT_416567 [Aspergillus ruber CBS 135680]|uniref:Saposin B-type domain-containing protein n=1 Tax=Aspergillus ruber (strain CBS 135680) TaxID=1388766 RepID=A0A017S3W9_ASPRC|nr:uncharacterized protein EURHEDRAFT_416567 [Aspergillus ruber CBS 135680]EYE91324.1 hypothetical protein EURHEDRAFT_416567 [Aspergillus ruber CBS 135680]